jgi:hypothetical protein
MTIADDAHGDVAPAIAWLHVNCGTTCHNGNSNAPAYPTGFRMRLDPALLDGVQPASSYDVYKTGVDQPVKSAAWAGQPRIAAGSPDDSVVARVIATRNDDFTGQMPPLVTKLVDDADVAKVRAWIASLPHAPIVDAGADAADAATDAGASAPDATTDAADSGAELDGGADAAADVSSDAPAAGG